MRMNRKSQLVKRKKKLALIFCLEKIKIQTAEADEEKCWLNKSK